MNWTVEQQRAIDERGKNILVAAAAGSGKTAVLVERIKKLIIQDGVPIDQMLIVTFTNAAAAEMKEKIRKAIDNAIEKDEANSKLLREQLMLLPKANISTFHAFALDVIRSFFYLADIEPGFSICDDAERTIIKEDALDVLLENNFSEGKEEFIDFLNCYSGDRNFNKIRAMIDSMYNSVQAMPEPWISLSSYVEGVRDKEMKVPLDVMWSLAEEDMKIALDAQQTATKKLEESGLERLSKIAAEEKDAYADMFEHIVKRDFESVYVTMNNFPKTQLRANKEEKEGYEAIKDEIKAYRDSASDIRKDLAAKFFSASLDMQIQEVNSTYALAGELERLLLEFDRLFAAGKKEKHLMDFGDIEHNCYNLLQNEQVSEYYRDKFQYIFIDEYQDTNLIQEAIIDKIKRDNNLFMVGDIKQSIYKFRLAEPEIFKEKYESYSEGTEMESMAIDLNKNYRSKSHILGEINKIFKDIMEGYDDRAKLYPGIEYRGKHDYIPNLKLIDLEMPEGIGGEIKELKAAELEALQVGKIIEENVGETYFDTKTNTEKKIGFKDIVILMRGMKTYAETFYNVLKQREIPVFIDDTEGYFDTIEINIAMNLLSVIDNKHQDIPLISILHSEIFGFTTEELALIRIADKEESFANACMKYSDEGESSGLRIKVINALKTLDQWKKLAMVMSLPDFIWKLLMDSGYYLTMGAMPYGRQRQANLRALVDKALIFSEKGQVSLYSFVRYIDAVKSHKVAMGQVKLIGENEDIVRIMTIHKSKGLEFPVVIVAGMGRRLNYTRGGGNGRIHKDVGLALMKVNPEERWSRNTLMDSIIEKLVKKEEVSEEKRILYVAMTRAKDRLYLSGTVKSAEEFKQKMSLGLHSDSTYLSMIPRVTKTDTAKRESFSYALSIEEERDNHFRVKFENIPEGEDESTIIGMLNYKYPYESKEKIKSKYSVSELNRGEGKETKLTLAVPKFKIGETKISAAIKGIIYHGFMERISFTEVADGREEYILEEAHRYVSEGIFSEEEVGAVDVEKLTGFFDTDIGKRCVEASARGKLFKETPFNMIAEKGGEEIIIQGIIDCYFITDRGVVLIDYKTNRIDSYKPIQEEQERLKVMYAEQMKIYGKAISEATGMQVVEAYLYLFADATLIDMKGEF